MAMLTLNQEEEEEGLKVTGLWRLRESDLVKPKNTEVENDGYDDDDDDDDY